MPDYSRHPLPHLPPPLACLAGPHVVLKGAVRGSGGQFQPRPIGIPTVSKQYEQRRLRDLEAGLQQTLQSKLKGEICSYADGLLVRWRPPASSRQVQVIVRRTLTLAQP